MGLIAQSAAMAQSAVSTDNVPNIEHEFIKGSIADPYTFTAKVSDDSKVTSVVLLYRYNDTVEFQRLSMMLEKDDITYSARIPEAERRDGTIQYYFIAFDDRGNAKVNNFEFDPFARTVSADWQPIVSDAPIKTEPVNTESAQGFRKIKPLHILLGVLAVGAVAAAAGGGGSSGGGGGGSCAGTGCSITLTLPTPGSTN